MKKENRFYVYVYLDPRIRGKFEHSSICFLFKPFYIGKGSGSRLNSHMKPKLLEVNSPKNNKIKKIIKHGENPIVIKLIDCLTESESLKKEKELIRDIGLDNLTNLTNGGEGLSGYKHSKETKNKIKKSLIGKNTGRSLNEEWRIKIKENNAKYWLNKHHSDETKKKLRDKTKEKNIQKGEKKYKITSPHGEKFITKNLSEFCKIHNLQRSKMVSVSTGNRNHHKQWKCVKVNN